MKTPDVIEGESGPSGAGYSQIADFLRCPKAYQFKQIRKLHKPVNGILDHFAVGSLVHAGRAKWFALGFPDPETKPKRFARVLKAMELESLKLGAPVSAKALQDASRYVLEYVQHWKMRPKPTITATEYMLGPAPLIADEDFGHRTARLDDFGKYEETQGQLAIGECKTTSASIGDTIKQYQLHGQPIMQTLLWDSAPQGKAKYGPIAGVVLDVIQKGYGAASKFARIFIPVSEHQKQWFAESMSRILKQAADLKADSFAERRTTGCTFMAGRGRTDCDYKELCAGGRPALSLYVKANNERPGKDDWR